MAKYENVKVKLIGEDGNAFSILASIRTACKKEKLSPEVFEKYRILATSGDYDNLLRVTMEWFNVE